MEELMNDVVAEDVLEKFEKKYLEEYKLDGGNVCKETKFEYAHCLVRSRYTNDINKALIMLEQLARDNPDGKREYIYYIAYGNARLKKYSEAMKYCDASLKIEPNEQVRSLKEYIEKKLDQDMIKGAAVAGGVALALGGLIGLGVAMAKK